MPHHPDGVLEAGQLVADDGYAGHVPAASDTGDTATGSNARSLDDTGHGWPLADGSPPEASSSTAEVLGAEASRTEPMTLAGASAGTLAGTMAGSEVAGVSAAPTPAVFTTPYGRVLPNTGAGKALGLFLLLGVVAVALGAWMLTKRGGLASKQV